MPAYNYGIVIILLVCKMLNEQDILLFSVIGVLFPNVSMYETKQVHTSLISKLLHFGIIIFCNPG